MKDKKYADDDPERTLVTLDQLSQTIEVMTSVVNRLRRHLSDQIQAQLEAREAQNAAAIADAEAAVDAAAGEEALERSDLGSKQADAKKRESFVVEISQHEIDPIRKSNKILH